jgi:hypothetical protein
MRKDGMGHPAQLSVPDPWSWSINVEQIPETGSQVAFEANEAQRAALAAIGGLREVMQATALFELSHAGGGKVHVTGRVRARIGQTCVVTLDPIENNIDEPIDLVFAPEADIPKLAALVDNDSESDEIPDPPEPIVNGMIDLGRVATDALFLGIDPYPRKPDAIFELPAVAPDPEDHPFAALKALQNRGKPRSSD